MTHSTTLRHIALLFLFCFTMLAGNAYALDLQTAKAQGMVGEQADGYLGIVRSAPGVQALVNDINSRRRAHYEQIAKKNGTSVQVVEALAGKKAIDMTPRGQFVRDQSGNWIRK